MQVVQLVLAAVALAPVAVVAQQEVQPQAVVHQAAALGPALGPALIRLRLGALPLLHHLQPALVVVAATIRLHLGALLLQHLRPALVVVVTVAVAVLAAMMQAQLGVVAAGVVMMVEVPDLPCLMRPVHKTCKALLNVFTGIDPTSPSK